eukprot:TRINITY_DN2116_c0_g1_i1.p1 TRINITY_DN2116_c0_g1~~TRINITY_DN2116_c0_g1_i1.p1  ORF type:complete len:296 (-),score=71.80 TRINITY_DN2116_c0_g1_i1:116-1003(-)
MAYFLTNSNELKFSVLNKFLEIPSTEKEFIRCLQKNSKVQWIKRPIVEDLNEIDNGDSNVNNYEEEIEITEAEVKNIDTDLGNNNVEENNVNENEGDDNESDNNNENNIIENKFEYLESEIKFDRNCCKHCERLVSFLLSSDKSIEFHVNSYNRRHLHEKCKDQGYLFHKSKGSEQDRFLFISKNKNRSRSSKKNKNKLLPVVDVIKDEELCLICTEKRINGKISNYRLCTRSKYPCDNHVCNCSTSYCCFDCLATNLWKKSSSFLRDQGRFRANCPFCKAEYCHNDLIIIKYKK